MKSNEGLTKENIKEFLRKGIEAIKKSTNIPDMYYTHCVRCKQAVLAPAYVKVETCQMCEANEILSKK
jgi:hypothetical protein